MPIRIFTAPGCQRCDIAKAFMTRQGREYAAYDFQGDGAKDFTAFYRANRAKVFRGPEGIEFPIIEDGENVVQGVGEILAWLQAGEGLAGFVSRSELSHGWIDGLDVSAGDPARADDFLGVLTSLKKGGLQIQLTCDGRNPGLLQACLDQGLADKLIVNLAGPAELCREMGIDPADLEKTIALAAGHPDHVFQIVVGPVVRAGGEVSPLTREEVVATAALIERVTGDKKQPFLLAPFDPAATVDERLRHQEPTDPALLLKLRSAARRHLVLTEIKK